MLRNNLASAGLCTFQIRLNLSQRSSRKTIYYIMVLSFFSQTYDHILGIMTDQCTLDANGNLKSSSKVNVYHDADDDVPMEGPEAAPKPEISVLRALTVRYTDQPSPVTVPWLYGRIPYTGRFLYTWVYFRFWKNSAIAAHQTCDNARDKCINRKSNPEHGHAHLMGAFDGKTTC
ncbi:uncharacterized protein EV420DRAFT_1753602 [Desarmillaria tabescens]|uniref:Uncharacterized protein n=1 Tax=Armillaria tabescens TaxID=1929756 RepID=A0AA39J6K0_ARMTA|nr:uncharacterized protein EV420DRAFT_1753602 [Desarmillaria tabescens]KAK0437080.1 hypothetical protein EV420DRAFT_1753602 [Desarmillaria tabescens]